MRVFPTRSVKRGLFAVAAVGAVGAILAVSAPAAMANWTGSLSGWSDGVGESRRWNDTGPYTQIKWEDCEVQGYGQAQEADVRVWRDINLQPDVHYGSKEYVKCFNSDTTRSIGEWNNLTSGTYPYYFKTPRVGTYGTDNNGLLHVSWVGVDTSLAD
ncbi:hypothetical protein [Nocardioides albus]|uniref:Secreted protein n=1 Tax=Nocardioides albus TaxID=1841 RepID=A0A7W5F6J3_9ACTN|nr:hypothetical protein [Nocardioides albus]MBB3087218.1 hypothetical protein [Nocardioides albus]GGU07469.1 hypothetical protein GCM10007979_01390 [Nocardioides albus]